jgi:type I restriction enzyme S subunit
MCEISSGGTPSRSVPAYWGGSIPWAKISDIEAANGQLTSTEEHISDEGLASIGGRIFEAGTLLVAQYGSVGKWAFARTRLATNQAILGIRPTPPHQVAPEYLAHYLTAERSRLERDARGVTQKNLSLGYFRALELPLPPLPEQKRIAAILDKADAIRAKRREALAQADALLRATFLDLFGDPTANPKGWETLPIAEIIADGPQNGLYRHSSNYGSGTPILRIDSFYDGRTKDLSSLKRVRIDEETISRWALHADDIVINRVNSLDYLGKSAIVPLLREPTVFESNMMRFAVDRSIIEPGFLIDQLQTGYVQRQIRKRARPAVNQSSINQDDVKSIEVRVPPIQAQKAYVAAAKRIERFGEGAGAALADADALYASLAQRAFRGEL